MWILKGYVSAQSQDTSVRHTCFTVHCPPIPSFLTAKAEFEADRTGLNSKMGQENEAPGVCEPPNPLGLWGTSDSAPCSGPLNVVN